MIDEVVFISKTEVVAGRYRIHLDKDRLVVNEYTHNDEALTLRGGLIRTFTIAEDDE